MDFIDYYHYSFKLTLNYTVSQYIQWCINSLSSLIEHLEVKVLTKYLLLVCSSQRFGKFLRRVLNNDAEQTFLPFTAQTKVSAHMKQ